MLICQVLKIFTINILDGDVGLAVLHMDGDRSAVTVHMLSRDPTTFYFPGSTALIRPCSSPTNGCPNLALDVIFKGQGSGESVIIMGKLEDAIA